MENCIHRKSSRSECLNRRKACELREVRNFIFRWSQLENYIQRKISRGLMPESIGIENEISLIGERESISNMTSKRNNGEQLVRQVI